MKVQYSDVDSISDFKKLIVRDLGIAEKSQTLSFGDFEVKMFRFVQDSNNKVENYEMTTQPQWVLEREELFKGNGEVNGEYILFHLQSS